MGDMAHKHGVTSNTDEVFRTFIGCGIRGLIKETCERTLVFDCGWGLTFNTEHGSYWTESPDEIERKLYHAKRALADSKTELEGILKLAGETP
jgi:hypothetical protein